MRSALRAKRTLESTSEETEAERDGHAEAENEQQDARRRLLLPFDLVGDGGHRAEHQPRKEGDDGEQADVYDLLDREKPDDEPDDDAEHDGDKEPRALSELSDEVAQRKQELAVQF